MPKMTFVKQDGTRVECEAPLGLSVLEIAHRNAIDLEGACEGSLACSTCHVVIDPEWYDALVEASEDEEDMLDLAFGLTHEKRKPEGEKSPTQAGRWRGQLARALDTAPAMLQSLPSTLTLGHLGLACALGYLDLRHDELGWRNGRDELAAWYETMARRPSLISTEPPK